MRLGIISLVIGILLLFVSIPYSIYNIIVGVLQIQQQDFSGGIMAYAGIVGVIMGFLLTTIGVVKVAFGNKRLGR